MRRLLAASLLATAALACLQARAADQVRSVAPFTSISNTGPISVRVEAGKAQSVTATGDEAFLRDLRTEVVDGELRLSLDNHRHESHHGETRVTITVPRLDAFAMSGAGDTTLAHVEGERLEIRFSGAGSIRADGRVDRLRLAVSGVGSLDTRDLHANAADVEVSGVGSVKVFAADRLDANVSGIGSVTYYGDPKVANTRSSGIGSVSRGR